MASNGSQPPGARGRASVPPPGPAGPPPGPGQPPPAPVVPPAAPRRKRRTGLIVGLLTVLLLALAVGGVVVVRPGPVAGWLGEAPAPTPAPTRPPSRRPR